MEAMTTISKSRTREEILAWLQQARERKEAFQRRVNEEWEARQRSKKAKKKYTADDFAGIWDDEHFMAAEDINKAIRDARHVKSGRDEFWDKFLNEP